MTQPTKNNVGIGWTSLSLCVLILFLCRRHVLSPTFYMFWCGCDATCVSAGAYRLARLPAKFGSEMLLEDLLARLSANCAWRDDPRGAGCGVRFSDLPSGPPPDMPRRRMRVIQGGRG